MMMGIPHLQLLLLGALMTTQAFLLHGLLMRPFWNHEQYRLHSSPSSNVGPSFPGSIGNKSSSLNWEGVIPMGPTDLANIEAQMGKTMAPSITTRSQASLRYFKIVEDLAPNEMLSKFAVQAPANVQEAAKSTVMSILGQLPNYALDASLITTSTKLANLIYQMQMTGYMLKNGEYRISMTRQLKGLPKLPPASSVTVGNVSISPLSSRDYVEIAGEAKIRTKTGESLVIDVAELTGALSKEVEALRAELAIIRDNRETELRSNLLTYIQALPERELMRLTSDMSADVMESINMLVSALIERLGISSNGPEVVVQQSMGAMAQLCLWQLVVGYRLRELEALDLGAAFEA